MGLICLDQVRVERKVRIGSEARDFPGLPVDDAGQDQGQTGTGVDLVVDLTGSDTAPVAVVDGARQGVELLDFQEASAYLGAQLRLGHVLQHELGLEDAAEFTIGGVESVRGLEAIEPLQGGGGGGMAGREGGVELADAFPLLGDQTEADSAAAALQDRLQGPVVALGVGAVDALAVQVADAWAEAHADHGESGEVEESTEGLYDRGRLRSRADRLPAEFQHRDEECHRRKRPNRDTSQAGLPVDAGDRISVAHPGGAHQGAQRGFKITGNQAQDSPCHLYDDADHEWPSDRGAKAFPCGRASISLHRRLYAA